MTVMPPKQSEDTPASAAFQPHMGAGLLHPEPEEGGIVGRRELEANASIDRRYRFRGHGEGCEGLQVSGSRRPG
jgi:hypothetical protein